MELSISHSLFRVPYSCKPFSHGKYSLTTIKSTTKENDIKSCNFPSKCFTNRLNQPMQLYGESKFSKSLSYGQHKRNSIRACGQAESSGFDLEFSKSEIESSAGSNPVLGKAQIESVSLASVLAKVSRFGASYYQFVRPIAINRAIISSICLYARVFVENPQLFNWPRLITAFPGLIAIVLAYAYYIGINQIYDVDIDRVNKPHLPIPAGDLSLKQAWFLVISNVLGGLLIFRLMNADIITTSLYCLGLFFGTTYSVPPFRFKRYSFATNIVLPLTCGVIHNVGVLYATRASLGLPFLWSPPVVYITIVATLFFVIISTIKDLTDIEGDMKHNIQTFTAKIGPRNVTFLCTGVLLVNYIGAIAATILMPQAFKSYLMLPAHAILALWLLFQVRKLDNANYSKEESANFFQFLWKLLNLEFLLFPFI